MTTPSTPPPAHITLSLQNVRDFIRAKGQGVPINIPSSSLRAFIESVAGEWQFNLTSMPRGLVSNCSRAGALKAEEAIRALIPADLNIEANLPRYLAENCARAAAEAAEGAIRPWVLSGVSHTSPTRQKAGKHAAQVKLVLETWKTTAGVKIFEGLHGTAFICAANEVIEENMAQSVYLTAAYKQEQIVDGDTELAACYAWSLAHDIAWPAILSEEMEKGKEKEG